MDGHRGMETSPITLVFSKNVDKKICFHPEEPQNLSLIENSPTAAPPKKTNNSLDRHGGRLRAFVRLHVDDALGVGLAEAGHRDGPPKLPCACQLVARPGIHAVCGV